MSRECGACSACCHRLGVPEIEKPAQTLCPHLHEKGFSCTIYAQRPHSCAVYACSWLRGMGDDEDRPDKSGVLVDRQFTRFGHVLVARSLTPDADKSPKGRAAVRRIQLDEVPPMSVVYRGEDDAVEGVVVSQDQPGHVI